MPRPASPPPLQLVDRETFINCLYALSPGSTAPEAAFHTLFLSIYDDLVDARNAILTLATMSPQVAAAQQAAQQQGGAMTLADMAQQYASAPRVTEGGDGGMGPIISQAMAHAIPNIPNAPQAPPPDAGPPPNVGGTVQGESPIDPALMAMIDAANAKPAAGPKAPPNGGK